MSCPELEELSALLDGRLAAGPRRSLVRHLGHCEACYEVFAGSARTLDELSGGRRRPIAFPAARHARPELAAAAGLAALVTAALLVTGPRHAGTWRDEIARLGVRATAAAPDLTIDHGWSHLRGEADRNAQRRAFRIGVLLLDLEVALARGEAAAADRLLADLGRDVAPVGAAGGLFADELLALREPLAERLAKKTGRRGARRDVRQVAEHLQRAMTSVEAGQMRLGAWAEAGRLAALAGDRRYFGRASAQRPPVYPAASALVDALRRTVSAVEGLPAGGLEPVARGFSELVATGGGA